MRIKEVLTYDITKSERFQPLAPALNFLFGVFFLWLGGQGIATRHIRFKGYDYSGFDAQLFGVGLCGLGGAWVLYTTLGAMFIRFAWCRIAAGMLGLTFIVCGTIALLGNI